LTAIAWWRCGDGRGDGAFVVVGERGLAATWLRSGGDRGEGASVIVGERGLARWMR